MATIAAYTINGFTRPELTLDLFGNIVLDDTATAFAQTYGLRALYLGCPPNTPYPPVLPSLLFGVDANGAPNTVAEGAAANTTVGVTAHATSLLGFPVNYSLTGDSSGGGFKINSTTGVVSVADPSKIDFESSPGHSYNVTVRANDGILTTFRTFTIDVSDVAPSTPVDANGATNTVAEGAANGTAVGVTASATDVNGGTVTYSLTNNANGAFAINSTTGVITVADSTKIDFETAVGHAYTVTARASDSSGASTTQNFTIGVSDVAPSTPLDSNGAANTVAEGAANGSTVGITASSVDPNGPATTYSLTDNAGGRFAINSSTGVVTVANGAAIDFETAAGHAYGITVQATSGATSTTQVFSIGVTDVGPSAPADSNGAANTVFEGAANGTLVGITAAATDPGGGPAPTYSLTDNAGGRFAIDANTGIVTVANGAAIDFESAAGHAYSITVQTQAGALTNSQNFSIGVADVNEAPAGADKAVLIAEDTTFTFGAADFGFTDPSDSSAPNSLLAVKITTVPGAGEGTLTNNGVTVNAGDSVSAADIAAGHLVFTPVLNANGSPEAAFTFQVQDNGGTANGGVDLDQSANTFIINVNAGNDAPINSVPGTQSVNEEATLTFSAGNGNAITISDVDIGSGDETVTLTVTSGTLALGSTAGLTSFTNNAASITLTGTVANVNAAMNGLAYTGNLNFNGADSLVVSTNDNGNTGTGGPQNDTDSITINVAPVNDAPVNGVPGAQTVNEDTNLVFTGANTITISDVDGGSGDETVTLTVTGGTLALGSTLNLTSFTNNAASITLTGTIANINAAMDGLTYHGNLNFNGADSLSIVTHDNGNTGGGDLTDTDSVAITVTAVNDAPSFTVGGGQTVLEDSGVHTVNGFITGISPGPADEAVGQTVNFLTSNDNNALFSAGPTIDASGNLTYTLAANANGSATVTVQIHDNGGTANGGSDTSGAQTFTITAGQVNDAPAGADNTFTIIEDGARTFTAADFGFTDPVDAANTSGANAFQAVIITTLPGAGTGTLTLDTGGGPVAVVAGQSIPVGQISGLAFAPAANANGNGEASFTFQVQDNGGTANAGVDTDQSANTITFNVTSVNDAPAGTDTTIASVGPHTFAASEFGFTDPADAAGAGGPDALQAVIITTIPTAGTGTLELNGVAVTAGDSIAVSDIGGLVFTPVGNNTGTFTFQVQDNGGTANSGVDTDQSPNSFTIQQNDPPIIDSDGSGATAAVSAAENQTAVTTVHATDPDNGPVTPVSYSIVGGDDQLKFAIDSSTGVLTFVSAPDFENPTDTSTAGNNTYIVTVQAFDGASVDQQTITVTMTDVNDTPVITSNGGLATASINVNENSTAVTTVTATDQESPAQTLTYSLAGGADQGKFSIDSSTGVLTFNSAPNFEVPTDIGGDNGYDVIVRVTDSGAPNLHDDQAITVHVQNVNEAPDTAAVTVTGNEDAASIAITITGTDVDSGDSVSSFHITNIPNAGTQGTLYSDIGLTTQVTEGADVTASGNAATLYFKPNADFNTHTGAVTFNAAATDTHGLTDATPGTETINVTAVDDAPINNGAPSSFTVQSGFNHVITGLSISDVDANEVGTPTDITTTFTAGAGTVVIGNGASGGTAGIAGGATITTNGSGTVVLTGSVAQINTTLSGNNVAYNAADGAGNTSTTLQMVTNDHGHNGSGGPISDTDTINIGVIPQVWFINQDQSTLDSTAVRGSQANPFATVDEFNASSGPGANDYIYVKEGTYDGEGINLKAGQTLLGDDQALSFANPLGGSPIVIEDASGARPVISVNAAHATDQGIALASGNTIAGIVVTTNASGQVGIDDSGASVGTLNISDSDVTGGGQAINLTHGGTGGTVALGTVSSSGGATGIALGGALATNFSATTGTLSGHTGSEFSSNGGSGTVSYGGAIGDGTGTTSVSIVNRSGGTVTLSGNITDGSDVNGGFGISGNNNTTINFTGTAKTLDTGIGDGVSITNNTGTSNVNFTNGGLAVHTSNGTAFSDTVSGTVSVTGLGNTLSTTGTGTALNLANVTVGAGGITFDSASTTNAANGIVIDTVSGGAINVNGGAISGASSHGVDINAAQSNITIAASITSTAAGNSVEVTNSGKSGGNTISFSGAITDPGHGINLDNNDQNGGAATINFSGALNIDSTTHTGFNATNGGTVNVTNAANSITTTTGTAVNIANTTIGASNVTFHDVSANGGANGIVLNTTGSTGGFHLTGNGTNVGATGGGVIQNMTGADGAIAGTGIYLNSTHDVQLNGLQLNNFSNFGVRGLSVDGVSLTNTTISGTSGNNDTFDEAAVAFGTSGGTTGITGTGVFTNLNVRGGFENNLQFFQTSGTSNLTFTNLSSHDTKTDSPSFGADGFLLETQSSANSTVLIQGSNFSNNFTQGVQANALDTSTLNMTVRSSTFSNNNEGVVLANSGSGHLTAMVGGNTAADGNTVTGQIGVGIFVGNAGVLTTNALLVGAIRNNNVTQALGHNNDAIKSLISGPATGSPSTVLDISNNTATTPLNVGGGGFRGIFVDTPDTGTSPTFDVTVNNNTVSTQGLAADGIALQARRGNGDFHVQGNSSTSQQGDGIYLRQVNADGAGNPSTFDLERGVSGSNDPATIVLNNNPAVTGGATHTIGISGAINPVANGAVTTVPLLASAGGVVSALSSGGDYHLSQVDLNTVVQAAIARWDAAGLSANQLSLLHNLTFSVADMDGAALGVSAQGSIKIDSDGGSYGWFVDTTPQGDTEFGHAAAATHLTTDPTEAAAGHMDLLTTVMHEMGHQLGLEDSYATGDRDDLMFGFLTTGERRLPDASDVALSASTPLNPNVALGPAGTHAPIVIGTPGNDTIDAGHGGNILVGGAGADNFVFANVEIHTATLWSALGSGLGLGWGWAQPVTPPTLTHVADYNFAQGDSFDFSALTSTFHGSWANDARIVRAVEDPSGSFATLQVNASRLGSNWVDVAQIDGAHAGDAVNVLIDGPAVHLAQLHVGLLV